MKSIYNLLLFTISGLICSFNSHGQNADNSKLYIEAQGGINFSTIRSLGTNIGQFKPGLNGGLFVGKELLSYLFVESGFGYTSKGFRTNFDILSFSENSPTIHYSGTRDDFHYVTIPLRIGMKFGKKVQFFAKNSLNMDFLVQTHSQLFGVGESLDRHDYNKIKSMNRFDVSLTNSVGFNVPIGKYYVGTTFSQNIGLRSFSKSSQTIQQPISNNIVNLTALLPHNFVVGFNFQVGYNF